MKYLIVCILSLSFLQLYAKHDIPPTSEFKVTGVVKKELTIRIADLGNFKQDTLGDLITRNRKGEQQGVAKRLKGVLLKTILDSAEIIAEKPKDYCDLAIILTASDGFKNVFSWNELFNTEVGNHVYLITEMDGQTIKEMPDRILILSLSDFNAGGRHLKGLASIEVKKI